MTNQLPTHILNHLLNNEDFCRRVVPYLKNEYFEGTHKTVFDLIVSFVSKHNKLPTSKILELELKKINAPEDVLNNASRLVNEIAEKSDIDTDYLLDESEKWCKERAVYNAIMDSIQIIDGKDNERSEGAIPEILSKALGVSFDEAIGHDYIDNSEERFENDIKDWNKMVAFSPEKDYNYDEKLSLVKIIRDNDGSDKIDVTMIHEKLLPSMDIIKIATVKYRKELGILDLN